MSGRARWASRKYREAIKYHQDRIESANKGILIYTSQAAKIRRGGVAAVQWFADFLEDVCIRDLEAQRARSEQAIQEATDTFNLISALLIDLENQDMGLELSQ